MNKIAVSILALGAALATPALANEAVHNGQRVTVASVVPAEAAVPAAIGDTLSFASVASAVTIDPARGSLAGK